LFGDMIIGEGVDIATDEEAVFTGFTQYVDLAGAVVAEVGGSFPTELLAERRVARWYSIDPNRTAGVTSCGVREVLAAPAERMPLPDGSVDAVFSSNAFQFVDVPAVLAEARRVLRPGGLLYAHFGPVWSGVDGHQLEYVTYQGRQLEFWEDTLLPPWAHLAYGREELRTLLRSALPADLADLLVWHVHDSETVNRAFFEDYVTAALGSGLCWVELSASEHLDYEIEPPAYDPELLRRVDRDALAAELSARRGAPTQLGIRDVLMVLRKPTSVTRQGES
jgi:SAM-dependent methyltransferase